MRTMADSVNKGGAPVGNDNARRGSLIRGAIRRAFAEDAAKGRDTLHRIVRKMVDDAEIGDKDARRELFDRLDGKPEQANTLSGDVNVHWALPKAARENG